jgi:hypothetical protein
VGAAPTAPNHAFCHTDDVTCGCGAYSP